MDFNNIGVKVKTFTGSDARAVYLELAEVNGLKLGAKPEAGVVLVDGEQSKRAVFLGLRFHVASTGGILDIPVAEKAFGIPDLVLREKANPPYLISLAQLRVAPYGTSVWEIAKLIEEEALIEKLVGAVFERLIQAKVLPSVDAAVAVEFYRTRFADIFPSEKPDYKAGDVLFGKKVYD